MQKMKHSWMGWKCNFYCRTMLILLWILLPTCWGQQCTIKDGRFISCTKIGHHELYNQLFKYEDQLTPDFSLEVLDSNYTTIDYFARPNMKITFLQLKISRCSVTNIDELAFKDIAPYMNTLDLSQNNIEDVSFAAVFQETMKIYLLLFLIPVCWGENCTISSEKISCTNIDQRELYEQLFKNEDQFNTLELSVEVLDSDYTTIDYFPKPNLQIINSRQVVMTIDISQLRISRSSVTNISEVAFWELGSTLSSLDLSQNNIEDVSFLKSLATLQNLDLSENKIKIIDFNFVRARNLILSSNLISSFVSKVKGNRLSFDVLDLAHNQLMKYNEIDTNIFGKSLDLRYNSLTDIELVSFFNSYKTIIKLNNDLESLGTGMFICDEIYLTYMPSNQLSVSRFVMSNAIIPVLNKSYVDMNLIGFGQPIHLDFSNSSITDIEPSFFSSKTIDTLRLDSNMIEIIKPNYFDGVGTINTLLNISFSEVKIIEKGAFDELTSCKLLDLSHNLLQSLENICGPQRVDISFNNFSDIDLNSFVNCNNLVMLNMSYSNVKSIKSGSFSVLKVLDTLDLSNNEIKQIPAGVFNFSSIISLHLENNGIEVIESQAFKDMPRIFAIDLSNNKIQSIEAETFSFLPQISMIFLSNNKITILNNNAFLNLTVQDLRLDGNDIKYVRSKAFSSLNKITSLNFSNMSITYLEPESFYKCSMLANLDLSKNKLSALESYTFKDLPLNYLRLHGNEIEEIKPHAFSNLTYLSSIDLSSNKIQRIQDNAFDFVKVHSIFLENNNLTEPFTISLDSHVTDLTFTYTGIVPNYFINNFYLKTLLIQNSTIQKLSENSFRGLYRLTELHLNGSDIYEIQEGALNALYNLQYLDTQNLFKHINTIPRNLFNDLKNLRELNLSSLGISSIENGLFLGLKKLKTLILNNNNLTSIEAGIFVDLEDSLETLDLSYNQLKTLEQSTFDSLVNLKTLNLNQNFFSNIPILTTTTLINLYLSDNVITGLSINYALKLPVLETLHLQNNKIQQISYNFFSSLSNLLELRLDNNALTSLPVGVFHGIEKLERLNISQNTNIFSSTQTDYGFRVLSNLKYLNLAATQWPRSTTDKSSISNDLPKLITLKIDQNNLFCSQLFSILKSFDEKGIDYAPDYPVYSGSNIAGIGCTGN